MNRTRKITAAKVAGFHLVIAYINRDAAAAARLITELDDTDKTLMMAALSSMALTTTQAATGAGEMPPQIRQTVAELVGDVGGLGEEVAIHASLDDFAQGREWNATDGLDKDAHLHFLAAYNAIAGMHWSGKTPEQLARQFRAYATLTG